MKGGYFIGNFEPSAYRTKDFEVAYVKHPKNDTWVKHYHEIITEINFVLSGKVRINETEFENKDPREVIISYASYIDKSIDDLIESFTSDKSMMWEEWESIINS